MYVDIVYYILKSLTKRWKRRARLSYALQRFLIYGLGRYGKCTRTRFRTLRSVQMWRIVTDCHIWWKFQRFLHFRTIQINSRLLKNHTVPLNFIKPIKFTFAQNQYTYVCYVMYAYISGVASKFTDLNEYIVVRSTYLAKV